MDTTALRGIFSLNYYWLATELILFETKCKRLAG